MIKNKTSGIEPSDSMGRIQSLLSKNNARKIMIDYDEEGKPQAISFLMMVNQEPLQFRLTVNVTGLLRAMEKDRTVQNSYCTREQAERTAWKNKLEWLELQLAEIATGQADIQELLLGYAITRDGDTLYEKIKSDGTNLLTEGDHD